MNARQKEFVKQYLLDLNATQAALRAGYSEDTARSIASENLAKPDIAQAIQNEMDKRAIRLEITADKVLQELAKLSFANMLDYVDIGEDGAALVNFSRVDRTKGAAMQEITVEEFTERTGRDEDGKPTFENVKRIKFKLADKGMNLERLGKHLKLFTEKVEMSGDVNVGDSDQRILELIAKASTRRTAVSK